MSLRTKLSGDLHALAAFSEPDAAATLRLAADTIDDLVNAGVEVLGHLNARIDAAPSEAKPVFNCIVGLRVALAKAMRQ